MKKFLAVLITVAMVMSLVVMPISGTVKAVATGTDYYIATTGNDTTGDGSSTNPWKTIQHAIDTVASGDIIHVASGTYGEHLTINEKISIIGASETGVIIDASSYSSGYGISVESDNVTLKNFTLEGPTGTSDGYGIHSSGGSTLDYENLTVENSGRTGLDFIGCSNIVLDNIDAENNGGVGIAITDSNGASVSNITADGNKWGGMAVYTCGHYYPGGSSDITLSGTNSFGEQVPFYVQTDTWDSGSNTCSVPSSVYHVTNLNISNDFHYIVRAPTSKPYSIAFYPDLNTALGAAAAAVSNYSFDDTVVNDIASISTSGVIDKLPADDYVNYYVGPGMYIQSAVNDAVDNDTVHVMNGNGTYNENVSVTKSLTLQGAAGNAAIISPSSGDAITISANDVTIDGFTIDGGVRGIYTEGHTGITIQNNIIKNYNGQGAEGILVNGGGVTISGNTIEANEDGAANPSYSIDSIYTKGGATVTVTNNILRNNKYEQNAHNSTTSDWSTAAGLSVHEGDTVTATGNTIYNNDFGIHAKGSDTTGQNPVVIANFNKIYGNSGYGFFFEEKSGGAPSSPYDATNNWWGDNDKSGPYHPTLNPGGTGDAVSNNVTFDPWIGKVDDKTEGHAEGVTGGTVAVNSTETFENGTLGIGAKATTNADGSSDVMLVKYSDNPTNTNFTASFNGSYYDLNVTNPGNIDEIILKLYYPTTHGALTPFWFDTSTNTWKPCSNWLNVPGNITVDTCNVDNSSYAGYVAVTIDNTTTPSLSELAGTYFALGELSTVGGTVYPVNKAVLLIPWLLLLLSLIVGAIYFLRKKRAI